MFVKIDLEPPKLLKMNILMYASNLPQINENRFLLNTFGDSSVGILKIQKPHQKHLL